MATIPSFQEKMVKMQQQVRGPDPKAKSFEEDPGDILTHGWENIPNPRKDSTPAHGWGNRSNPKKDPAGIEVQGWHNNRLRNGGKSQIYSHTPQGEADSWSIKVIH